MVQILVRVFVLATGMTFLAATAEAQLYAALVMDGRTGKVIQATNADTRVHPASLTKMMTLYIVFDQVRRGRLSLDQKIRISPTAAAEPPSKLGLRAGQQIELRYLIRAAAIKSANDAATALGEAVSGSEAAFANQMNEYARAMGLKNTTFKNANGLTAAGHLSTARDMAELGRRLYFDFPQYYNIFSRNSTSAGIATVQNTNRRLLDAYSGADGIKTGYTRAAGFNLVSSAQRGNRRVIVAVLGAKSSASRNAEVAKLMDLGLAKMPAQARAIPPAPLRAANTAVAAAQPAREARVIAVQNSGNAARGSVAGVSAGPVATVARLARSIRPMPRVRVVEPVIARNSESIAAAIAEVNAELAAAQADRPAPALIGLVRRPAPRPVAAAAPAPGASASASTFAIAPPTPARPPEDAGDIVVANSGTGTTGGNDWGVQLGAFRNKGDAERQLLTTALKDLPDLNGGLRRVEAAKLQGVTIYRAQFVGLTREGAQGVCETLARMQADCLPLAPGI